MNSSSVYLTPIQLMLPRYASICTQSENFHSLSALRFLRLAFTSPRFPKTYPTLACPTFTIQQPIRGLNNDQITKLAQAIHSEAQKCRGSEMVFQVCFNFISHTARLDICLPKIVSFAQEWITNVLPPTEVGSLALQMNQRASDEERVGFVLLFAKYLF